MKGYRSRPFVAVERLEVIISPGMPLTVECDLTAPPKGVKIFPAKVYISVPVISDGNETTIVVESVNVKGPSIARIGGLAAGRYKLIIQGEQEDWWQPYLNSQQIVEMEGGGKNRFEPIYPNIDTTIESGDFTIKGMVLDKGKKPAEGKEVFLRPVPVGEEGLMSNLFYPVAVSSKDGSFEFKGVDPAYSYTVKSEKNTVSICKPEPNSVAFIDMCLDMDELQTRPGTRMQPITIQWLDGNTSNLAQYTGKNIVIDFWASWCSPCRQELPQLNDIATRYGARQDIVFIAVSVDNQENQWKKGVKDINCKALRHGWLSRKLNRFDLNKGVPYCIIVDKNGTIVAEGFKVDVEAQLLKLLKSEPSVGKEQWIK
jgi:thiol-disulfide isomerase/thioredoxin